MTYLTYFIIADLFLVAFILVRVNFFKKVHTKHQILKKPFTSNASAPKPQNKPRVLPKLAENI